MPSRISRSGFAPGGDKPAVFVDLDGTLIAEKDGDDYEPRPGADQFLDKLAKLGRVFLFTASTKNRALRVVAKMGWASKFSDIMSRENIQYSRRPPDCKCFVLVDNTPEVAALKMEHLTAGSDLHIPVFGSVAEAVGAPIDLKMEDIPEGVTIMVPTFAGGQDDALPYVYDQVCSVMSELLGLSRGVSRT